MAPDKQNGWAVYILRCSDDSLYTGITTDVARRITEHNESARGANYTRARRPVELAFSFEVGDRSAATRAEAWIKSKDRKTKESIIERKTAVPEALQSGQK